MSKLPKAFTEFKKTYEDVFSHYEALGTAAQKAGPLSRREIALVRLATAAGASLEGAVHSHCRRALEAGLTAEEIRHAIILQVTTLGFPSMMANLSRVNDILNENEEDKEN
ncbi:MAG: carboxymuconolactone decarboxylase family protein [Cyanobacteria bacterium]|nr:carboxymuconolactone decarboxylase family protein [Cyanobacteriota bacterium]